MALYPEHVIPALFGRSSLGNPGKRIIDPDFCNPYSFRRVAELQTKTRWLTLSSGIPGFYVAEWGKGAFYVARV